VITGSWGILGGSPALHVCGGRSASALRERISTLIMRFSAGAFPGSQTRSKDCGLARRVGEEEGSPRQKKNQDKGTTSPTAFLRRSPRKFDRRWGPDKPERMQIYPHPAEFASGNSETAKCPQTGAIYRFAERREDGCGKTETQRLHSRLATEREVSAW
jgi:hypothetical protein